MANVRTSIPSQLPPRAVICSPGVPGLELLAKRLRSDGYEVLLALPKYASPSSAQAAQRRLYMDMGRPEAAGLIARFAGDAALLVDGWGLPDDLPTADRKIQVHCIGAQAKDPEIDTGSVLLAVAGQSESVVIGAPDRGMDARCPERTSETSSELYWLGVDESQIMALSAESII